MDAEVSALKRRLVSWAKPEDFEIKGRDIRRGEQFFRMPWPQRLDAFKSIAALIEQLDCRIHTVQIDKRDLPEYIASDVDLYRIAFWRLLEEIDSVLDQQTQTGMLLVDMRSDMHSSIQDRRLIDAYREWLGSRSGRTRLIEMPWFGFSAFYAGLQLADFTAYLVDFVTNELEREERDTPLREVYEQIKSKVTLIRIP